MYTTESTARVLNATELRVVKPQKELDLTGMYLCQRKRKALDYIASVEARRNAKANKIAEVKETVGSLIGAISIVASLGAMYFIACMF